MILFCIYFHFCSTHCCIISCWGGASKKWVCGGTKQKNWNLWL